MKFKAGYSREMEMYSAARWERWEDEQWGLFNTFEAKPVCEYHSTRIFILVAFLVVTYYCDLWSLGRAGGEQSPSSTPSTTCSHPRHTQSTLMQSESDTASRLRSQLLAKVGFFLSLSPMSVGKGRCNYSPPKL